MSRFAHSKTMVIDRKVVLTTGSMNFTSGAAQSSENVALVSSEAIAAAYTTHWQNRLVASVPFTPREDWCRSSEVADFNSKSPPK